MILAKHRGGAESFNRKLALRGREMDDKEYAMYFNGDIFSWHMLGEAEHHSLSAERMKIVKVMQQKFKNRIVSARQISKYIGRSPQGTAELMRKMAKDGQIIRGRNGYETIGPGKKE